MSFPFYTPVHHVLFVMHLMILIYHYKNYMWLNLYAEALFLGKWQKIWIAHCVPDSDVWVQTKQVWC